MSRGLAVIPAYNEAGAIGDTLARLAASAPDLDVVVVDDGSSDGTAALAAAAGARVVRLPFNLGVGGAVRTGLRYAFEHGAAAVVILDADGQHDPADVAALLAEVEQGAGMAIGSRFAGGRSGYAVGQVRWAAMGSLQRLVSWSTGQRFTDTTSGFRALSAPVVELLAVHYPVEYLADTVEVLLMVHRHGFRVVEVPVRMQPRTTGQPSSRRLRLAFNYLRLLVGILASMTRPRPAVPRP